MAKSACYKCIHQIAADVQASSTVLSVQASSTVLSVQASSTVLSVQASSTVYKHWPRRQLRQHLVSAFASLIWGFLAPSILGFSDPHLFCGFLTPI